MMIYRECKECEGTGLHWDGVPCPACQGSKAERVYTSYTWWDRSAGAVMWATFLVTLIALGMLLSGQ